MNKNTTLAPPSRTGEKHAEEVGCNYNLYSLIVTFLIKFFYTHVIIGKASLLTVLQKKALWVSLIGHKIILSNG